MPWPDCPQLTSAIFSFIYNFISYFFLFPAAWIGPVHSRKCRPRPFPARQPCLVVSFTPRRTSSLVATGAERAGGGSVPQFHDAWMGMRRHDGPWPRPPSSAGGDVSTRAPLRHSADSVNAGGADCSPRGLLGWHNPGGKAPAKSAPAA